MLVGEHPSRSVVRLVAARLPVPGSIDRTGESRCPESASGRLRTREVYRALRGAIVTTFTREDFRIVHLSIQVTHAHLLVEADNRLALGAGMKAFGISAAKRINAALPRTDGGTRRRSIA